MALSHNLALSEERVTFLGREKARLELFGKVHKPIFRINHHFSMDSVFFLFTLIQYVILCKFTTGAHHKGR